MRAGGGGGKRGEQRTSSNCGFLLQITDAKQGQTLKRPQATKQEDRGDVKLRRNHPVSTHAITSFLPTLYAGRKLHC